MQIDPANIPTEIFFDAYLIQQAQLQTQKTEIQGLEEKYEQMEKRCQQYMDAYNQLTSQINELKRHRFGKRSERDIDPQNPQLDMLADRPWDQPIQDASEDEEHVDVPAHRRKKRAKNTDDYPRIIKTIEVPKKDQICACGCEKELIRYETKELYHYQPAEYCIIEQRRAVMACPKHCEKSIVTAPAPLQVLPKTKATEDLLAAIVVNKVVHRQPHYHLEKYMEAADISRDTMARWFIQLTDPLQPIINLMKDEVIDYDIASYDATTLQVLNEPKRSAEIKSYIYCTRGGPPDRSVILYDYQHEGHTRYIDEWFADFKGSIHVDAAPVFNKLFARHDVEESGCNAHARRYFEKVKKQAKKQGLAHDALRYYKKLYRVEREAKESNMDAQARYKLRLEKSKPILDEMKQWLDKHAPLVLPKSPLGKAFHYCLNHWRSLTHFLTDGRLEADNNHTEREIKPFVIARKNFMFSQSMAGARALAVHFSLIRTALLHGLNAHRYYVHILEKLPHCESVEDYEKLLPWNAQLEMQKNKQ